MTSLKEVIYKGLLHDFDVNSPHNINEQCGKVADGCIKELEELTLICPRHKLDKFSTMTEKWAFTQGYEFCREEMLSFLRGD